MPKGNDRRKATRQKPLLTLKEKRKAKRDKKNKAFIEKIID